MKKLHLLKCFDVTDAVKDGIEAFNNLSRNAGRIKKQEAEPLVQKTDPKKNRLLLVVMLAAIVKIFK